MQRIKSFTITNTKLLLPTQEIKRLLLPMTNATTNTTITNTTITNTALLLLILLLPMLLQIPLLSIQLPNIITNTRNEMLTITNTATQHNPIQLIQSN